MTSPPEVSRYQEMWATRSFLEDLRLQLEFRVTPFADSLATCTCNGEVIEENSELPESGPMN